MIEINDTVPMPCPFPPCRANVKLVREMSAPGPTAGAIYRVPRHDVVGDGSWYGGCPASLADADNLGPMRDELLRQTETFYRRQAERREKQKLADALRGPSGEQPQHSKTPRPTADGAGWFHALGSRPGEVKDELAARRARKGTITEGGSSVATVAEVRAAIDRANVLLAEAQLAVNATVQNKLGEAEALLKFVQQGSVDPLGAPQVSAAVALSQDIAALITLAIEQNQNYTATL